jgi:hypothetical protein
VQHGPGDDSEARHAFQKHRIAKLVRPITCPVKPIAGFFEKSVFGKGTQQLVMTRRRFVDAGKNGVHDFQLPAAADVPVRNARASSNGAVFEGSMFQSANDSSTYRNDSSTARFRDGDAECCNF